MTRSATRWRSTGALGRSLSVGGVGVALALTTGRPALVVLVAPLLVTGAVGLLHKPRREPTALTRIPYVSLHEGQATRTWVDVSDGEEVECVSRVVARVPYVALHPPEGAMVEPLGSRHTIEMSPRRWGRRVLGAEKVALFSPWAAYRWGPLQLAGHDFHVLPTLEHVRSVGEAPLPIGLIGAHRSRREGQGTEFSSIRAFHAGDRLRRINWRVSTRTGALHVEATRAEEDTAVLLLVDAMADYGVSGGIGGAESSLDITVRAAAAIAEQYLRGGDRVSLRVLSPAGEFTGYRTGTLQLRRVLTVLARIRPGMPRDVAIDQVKFRATAGTVVVVLSPMLSEGLANATVRLVRRGLPVVVVDPLPSGTAVQWWSDADARVAELAWRMRLLDRALLLERLAGAGCPVVPWNGPRTLELVVRRLARRNQLPRVGTT
ncbi:MAG: hypothetical protein QOK15_2161 [Nocardioidaceae bacterium]|nr:hypothetical protein [Nocardioidaceae bacterium]